MYTFSFGNLLKIKNGKKIKKEEKRNSSRLISEALGRGFRENLIISWWCMPTTNYRSVVGVRIKILLTLHPQLMSYLWVRITTVYFTFCEDILAK